MAAGDEEDFGSARITIDLDDADAVSDARDLGLRIARALNRATRDAGEQIRRNIERGLTAVTVAVDVAPDLSRFNDLVRAHTVPDVPLSLVPDLEAVDRAVRGHTLPELAVDLVADLDDLKRRVRALKLPALNVDLIPDVTGFLTRLRALLAGEEVEVRVVPDLSTFDARIRAHRAPDVTVNVDPDVNRFSRALSGLSGIAGKVGGALTGLLKFGAIGIAAAGAAQGVGGLLAALAPAAGIIAALPAAIAVTQVALNTLKLALIGVGDALTAAVSGSAEEFEKSLKGLAPAAQKAVTAVRAFQPELKKLQQAVQQSFFRQFSGDVTGAIKNLLPLGSGLDKIAANFGKAASAGLKFAATKDAAGSLKTIIQGTIDATGGLDKAVAPLAKGFLDVAAAVSKAFGAGAGKGIANAATKLGEFLTKLADSGRAVELVRNAVTVFKQIGSIASNVGGILAGVFKAANDAGGGLLNNLQTITASFETFVKSAEGQEAIGNLFGTVATIAAQLGPILSALVTQIGAIAPALAPIFSALGPALVGLIDALGPGLAAIAPALADVAGGLAEAFSAIGPSLGPLGEAIGSILSALAPLLPLVGQIVATLAGALAPVLSALAAAFAPIISALVDALMPILPPITAAFVQLVTALTPLAVGIGQAIADLFTQLAPVLTTLTGAVVQIVAALIPFVEQLSAALLPILPPLITAVLALVNAVVPLIPPIVELAAALGPLLESLLAGVAPILQFIAALTGMLVINVVVPLVSGIVAALGGLITILTGTAKVVMVFVDIIVGGFKYLYNVLVGNSIIPDLVNAIVRFFTRLPGRILGVISGLISSVVGVFQRMASSALSTVSKFVGDAITFLKGLPGKAVSALSGAQSALVSAGKDLILGLISGIKSMAGSLVSAAKGVVSGAISGAKSLLGISSPSKVFRDIGRDTGLGFVLGFIGTKAQVDAAVRRVTEGVIKIGREIGTGFIKSLTGTASEIKSTTSKLATDIASAFKGVKTTVDDRLIALVQTSNQRLQKLAGQRDAIAKKLAEAQKFATDTAASTLSTFSLQNLIQGDDTASTTNIVRGLKNAIFQVKAFTKQVDTLAQRGLNKNLLQQVLGLGAEKGAEIATALSNADKATLARINDLQKQLVTASDKLGRTGADALYDSGKAAGEGFLAGIKGQQKAIEQLMIDIAKGMQRAIRKALDIRSPSHVFHRIGEMTGAGLHGGLLSRMAALQEAARTAARGVVSSVASEFSRMPGLAGSVATDAAIPLTRGQRAQQREEARAAARPAAGSRSGGQAAAAGTTVNNSFTINEVGNARATAHRVANRLALAGSGL